MPNRPSQDPDPKPAAHRREGEDLVDLNLDEILGGDLQAVADAVASEYQGAGKGRGLPDRPRSSSASEERVDLESALTEAEGQMEDMLRREGELMDQHRRLAADFNNFRNRAQRDIALAVEQAERKILIEILPVLDNFDRGLGSEYQDVAAFRAGVELIRKQFIESLRRLNVEPLPLQVGDPFDATHAEALATFTDASLPDGAVAAIYERGFNLRGQLLRAARVVVNRMMDAEKS